MFNIRISASNLHIFVSNSVGKPYLQCGQQDHHKRSQIGRLGAGVILCTVPETLNELFKHAHTDLSFCGQRGGKRRVDATETV